MRMGPEGLDPTTRCLDPTCDGVMGEVESEVVVTSSLEDAILKIQRVVGGKPHGNN